MSGTRQIVFHYGTWNTQATYVSLTGLHDVDIDERTARFTFDVVINGGNSGQLQTAYDTMMAQLNQRHQRFRMSVGGTDHFDFIDGADGVVAAGAQEGAEFIKSDVELLGEHRTIQSRAYRITVTITRSPTQAGKVGVYHQKISLSTDDVGKRMLSFRAQFTPGPVNGEVGTAEQRYADDTYGFAALRTAITTALTGEWEQVGSLFKSYDEDARTLTAGARYTELLFDQSDLGRNDDDLIGAKYDIQVDYRPGYSIPGAPFVRPLTAVTVSWSSGVDVSRGMDLKDAINNLVVPYVSNTVAKKLLSTSITPKLLKHTLKADYVTNRVAGNLFFLVEETQVLELSKRVATNYRRGITLVPVLDGTEFTRDMHTGPGKQTLTVILGTRVLGATAAPTLSIMEAEETKDANRAGYVFVGYQAAHSPSTESYRAEGAAVEITTTVQTTTLMFEKATIRPASVTGNGKGTQQRQNPNNFGNSQGESGANAALTRAQSYIENALAGGF